MEEARIEHVCGNTRVGKTSYVVARLLTEDLKYFNARYYKACAYIKAQNKNYGTNLQLPPQRHVVSANFDVYRSYPNMCNYTISGYQFGVPNNHYKGLKKLIPYGVYVFDEAQRYWDSKDDRKLPPWVTRCFELSGHIHLKIFLITQRFVRLHADIRGIVDRFTYIEKSTHTYRINGRKVETDKFLDEGELIKTVWTGRQFTKEGEIEEYIRGTKDGKNLGTKFKFAFEGDIKSHYNPYNFAVNMEDADQDYEYFDYSEIKDEDRPAEWDTYKKTLTKEAKDSERRKQAG